MYKTELIIDGEHIASQIYVNGFILLLWFVDWILQRVVMQCPWLPPQEASQGRQFCILMNILLYIHSWLKIFFSLKWKQFKLINLKFYYKKIYDIRDSLFWCFLLSEEPQDLYVDLHISSCSTWDIILFPRVIMKMEPSGMNLKLHHLCILGMMSTVDGDLRAVENLVRFCPFQYIQIYNFR